VIFASQGAPLVSTTGVNDTGGKIATGGNDAGGKFCHQFCNVVNTGVNDNGGKFATGVNDAGGKLPLESLPPSP
jgi:hypothetical protein